MSVLGASIKCIAIGFGTGFLVQSGPNLGPDIWVFIGLLAFSAVIVLLFEFADLEADGRQNSQPERADARMAGKWEAVGKWEKD